MGAVPSTPRWNSVQPQDAAEYLIATFVGEKSYPISSDFWQKLLDLPLNLHWPSHRVLQACEAFAQNNYNTRHLAKLLIHLAWCLQECISTLGAPSIAFGKAINAVYISSVFLKYLIENAKTDKFEQLHLPLDESEPVTSDVPKELGQLWRLTAIRALTNYATLPNLNIEEFLMHTVLSFIGSVDVSSNTYILHSELLSFMLVAMSTQLLSGSSPGPDDVNPFIDAAMSQESSLVSLFVRKLLLNYIMRPAISVNGTSYSIFSEESQSGVLQKVGSVAANIVLLPLNYLVNSSSVGSRSQLADSSLHVLLVLVHYRKCVVGDKIMTDESGNGDASDSNLKQTTCFSDNPYCKALESAADIEFDRLDMEGNAHSGPVLRLPFASLFDTLGMCLADEAAVLLLYSLLQGNSDFLEYVLVRTDLDTLLMPILEALYNAQKRTSNQIYMLLIVLLILSQDSSFNATIHKLILSNVSWYKERLLYRTSLGSLMVIILIRTVQYNLSKLRDVYLHTTCLATLANMAPHVHRLSGYASQRLVSLFDMLSRKYNKIAESRSNSGHLTKENSIQGNGFADDTSTEMHIYTDFLRLVLEILNAILTYALPRNPEVVYAIMHREEVFQPFKNHPRFNELVENIYTVLDFFNSRMDAQRMDGEWSVEKVLQVIIVNCRSWRGEGIKMFTQLRFTYEQESHPEEFFIPYVWQLVVSRCSFSFNPEAINLFTVDQSIERQSDFVVVADDHINGESDNAVFIDV